MNDERSDFMRLSADADGVPGLAAVMQRPGIDDRTRALLGLAMVAARCEDNEVPAHVRHCVAQGLGRSEVGEALLQVYCYAGVYAGLSSFTAARAAFDAMEQAGELPAALAAVSNPPAPATTVAARIADGARMRRTLFGEANVERNERDADDFMNLFWTTTHDFCFGNIWSRPLFDHALRSQLCLAIASAAGQSGAVDRHVRSALRGGVPRTRIGEIFILAGALAGAACSRAAFDTARRVFEELDGPSRCSRPQGLARGALMQIEPATARRAPRRDTPPGESCTVGRSTFGGALPVPQPPWQLPVTELAALMARKALSPVELLEMYLARCERLNPSLNAIVAFDIEGARAAAKASEQRMMSGTRLGTLDGMPATIKDNLFVKGLPATWGSRLFEGFTPGDDDRVVSHLRGAGVVIIGKTNTPELSLASHTDNLLFGKTRNPWNTALTPGGSSGGAVAAIAAGLAPIAIGTDAGGSIRRPAGYVGIVGLRPSTGRIPRRHGFPALANDFQVIGPAARTVSELYEVFRTVAIPEAGDRASLAFGAQPLPAVLEPGRLRRLRIRYVSGIGDEPIDPGIRAAIARAAQQVAALGHEVVEGPVPFDVDQVDAIRGVLSGAAVARVVQRYPDWREKVGAAILDWGSKGLKLTATDYVDALDSLQALRARATAEFESFDILLTATSTAMPWPVEFPFPKQIDGRAAAARGSGLFSGYVNAAGLPAISVPVEPSPQGLPIGMQLVGAFGDDLTVLQLARQFEDAHPWAARWPALALDAATD